MPKLFLRLCPPLFLLFASATASAETLNPTTSRCEPYYEENEPYFEAKVITYRPTGAKKIPAFSETTKSLKRP